MDETTPGDILHAARQATITRVEALASELESIIAASAGSNADDEHDPEGSTLAYERARVAALLGDARASVGDLDRALARLDDGTYLDCERCGSPITRERLIARPATRTCVRCAATR